MIEPGQIVTFYSYKGGTGRSMQLANVAWILASNGKRVLMVDWDLEAPGLHRYFHPFLVDKELTSTDGLIDLLWDFAEAAMTPDADGDGEAPADWHEPYTDFKRCLATVRWEFPVPGKLDLLPAGRQGADYSHRVSTFNWLGFYERFGGGVFLESLKARMRRDYDYVLLDSRTGVSDTAGICTVQMPDSLVVCFTANHQNIEGSASVARSVFKQWAAQKPTAADHRRILPLLTRTDGAEKDKLNARRMVARKRFRDFLPPGSPFHHDALWRDLEVPYVAWHSYEEVLAVFGDQVQEKVSVLDSAEALTRVLTASTVYGAIRPDEADRARVLAAFTTSQAETTVADERPAAMPDPDLVSPYAGASPFTEGQVGRFFGRGPEIEDLVSRIRGGAREIYLVGGNRVGKTSLLRAGVIPRAEQGIDGERFAVRYVGFDVNRAAAIYNALEANGVDAVPGAIGRLLAADGAKRLLLVLDDLDVLASQADRENLRALIARLRGDERVVLLCALTSYDPVEWPEDSRPSDAHARSIMYLSPLRGDALREAIVGVARSSGVGIEPALVERLVAEGANEPAAMVLILTMLGELWHGRSGNFITAAQYVALTSERGSGLEGLLARWGDEAMAAMPAEQVGAAKQILLRLAVSNRRQSPGTVDGFPLDDLLEGFPVTAAHGALDRLVLGRLIAVTNRHGAARAELAHDALVTAWPLLAQLFADSRGDELLRQRLEERATEWLAAGRPRAALLTQHDCRVYDIWLARGSGPAQARSATARNLLAASRRAVGLRRVATAGAGLAIVVFTMFVFYELYRRGTALRERQEQLTAAEQRQARSYAAAGRGYLHDGRAAEAVPLLVAAREAGIDDVALHTSFWFAADLTPIESFHRDGAEAVRWNPNGDRVATVDDRIVRIWDPATGQAASPPLEHDAAVLVVAWSDDGTRLATASTDGEVAVWDATKGDRSARIPNRRGVTCLAFGPGDTSLLLGGTAGLHRWDLATEVQELATADVATLATSRDRTLIAFGERNGPVIHAGSLLDTTALHVWNASGTANALAISPDGTRIVVGTQTGATVLELATGRYLFTVPHDGAVRSVAWSDGRIATGGADHTARIWEEHTPSINTPRLDHAGAVDSVQWGTGTPWVLTIAGGVARRFVVPRLGTVHRVLDHPSAVRSLAWHLLGSRIATLDAVGTLRSWQLGLPPVAESSANVSVADLYAWSADGDHVVLAANDGSLHVYLTATMAEEFTVPLLIGSSRVALAADGSRLALASTGGIAIWSPPPAAAPIRIDVPEAVTALAWSADGAAIMAAIGQNVRVWNAATGAPVMTGETPGIVERAALSPDGTLIAAVSDDQSWRTWSVATGALLATSIGHPLRITALAWSPDSRRIATGSLDRTAMIWDPRTAVEVAPPLATAGAVTALAWTAAGDLLAVGDDLGVIRIYDARTGQAIGPDLRGTDAPITAAAWNPGGTQLATAEGTRVAIWTLGVGRSSLDDWRVAANRLPFRVSSDGVVYTVDRPGAETVDPDDLSGARLGMYVFRTRGCNACHAITGAAGIGPPVLGAYGTTFTVGSEAVAINEAYVRMSILTPQRVVRPGYPASMPAYALTDRELDGVVALYASLADPGPATKREPALP